MADIQVGATGEASEIVTEQLTAARWGSGLVSGFSTPAMIALMENASVQAMQPFLAPGQSSVGIEVSIKHLAATPVFMRVRARAEVVEVNGRRVRLQVAAWDDREQIGEGTHWRAIIELARFQQRLEEKAKPVDQLRSVEDERNKR